MAAQVQQNIHGTGFKLAVQDPATECIGGRIDPPLAKTETLVLHPAFFSFK
jgi:hypothetical protein